MKEFKKSNGRVKSLVRKSRWLEGVVGGMAQLLHPVESLGQPGMGATAWVWQKGMLGVNLSTDWCGKECNPRQLC